MLGNISLIKTGAETSGSHVIGQVVPLKRLQQQKHSYNPNNADFKPCYSLNSRVIKAFILLHSCAVRNEHNYMWIKSRGPTMKPCGTPPPVKQHLSPQKLWTRPKCFEWRLLRFLNTRPHVSQHLLPLSLICISASINHYTSVSQCFCLRLIVFICAVNMDVLVRGWSRRFSLERTLEELTTVLNLSSLVSVCAVDWSLHKQTLRKTWG